MDKQVIDVSRVLYADLDTPIALGVYLRQKYGEWDDFLAMRVSPGNYLDTSLGALKYFKDAQAVDLLRKFPSLPTRVNKRAVAVENFWLAEQQCARTNRFLKPFVENFGYDATTIKLVPFIEKVQRLVKRILGPLPADLGLRFGPGATFESKGHRFASSLTAADKMTMELHCTTEAVDLLPYVYKTAWGRAVIASDRSGHRCVQGNRFTTVPKDATKDRGICIEPGVNVSLQLAVGQLIRKRLRRFGIDLNQGQDLHRALARLGSDCNEVATMDLSNASDTVSLYLVKLLLPEEWYDLLASLRSPFTQVNGRWVRLEKFSSMGNGFTFELETLIFGTLVAIACRGTLGKNVFVYGDDIIYPSGEALSVERCLRLFGFTPNPKKSFSSGPFRESCGGDYFLGFPVRPFYWDSEPNEPASWISVINGLRRATSQVAGGFGRRARNRALANLPANVRKCRGPEILGDLVIHDDEELWDTVTRHSIRYVKVWRPILKRVKLSNYSPLVQLATALYGSAEGQLTNMLQLVSATSGVGPVQPVQLLRDSVLVPRNGVTGYRTGRVPYS